MSKPSARDLIRKDIELHHEVRKLTRFMDFPAFSKLCDHPFGTTLWYDAYDKAQQAHLTLVKPQVDALEAQYLDAFHLIRTLPEAEARYLYEAACYRADGDRGYGSWPDPDLEPEDWY